MRALILLLTLPLSAGVPLRVHLAEATVIWGSGIDPKGSGPAARFEVTVGLTGGKCPRPPAFRVWRVKIGNFPGLDKPGGKLPRVKNEFLMNFEGSPTKGGDWVLRGPWLGAPEPEDRLVVEVRWGNRRRGWAATGLLEQPLQVIGKRPGQLAEDVKIN